MECLAAGPEVLSIEAFALPASGPGLLETATKSLGTFFGICISTVCLSVCFCWLVFETESHCVALRNLLYGRGWP